MNRKFFVGSVGEPNKDYTEENRERCISLQAHVMHKDTFQKGVFDRVNTGDICFLKYNSQLIAFGEVKERIISTDKSLEDWTYLIRVNKWFFYDEKEKKKGVNKYGIANHTMSGAGQMGTIKEIDSDYGLLKMKEISGENNELYMKVKNEFNMNTSINNTLNILEKNKNLILTGAPGTGKTYFAKRIAQQMIFGDVKERLTDEEQNQFDEQCGFVQFHPSYDYTDFVEGLRPKDSNGEVGFEPKDGIFKVFCIKALMASYTNEVDNFKEVWEKFLEDLSLEKQKIQTTTGKNTFEVTLNQNGDGLVDTQPTYTRYYNYNQLYNVYRGLPGVPGAGHDNYRQAVITHLKKQYGLKDYVAGTKSDTNKKYVFIIDEINRGEISKVFGELFFSIDPGYRGVDGRVKTQYSNIQNEPSAFDLALGIKKPEDCGWFFVPENVYIIGTMNDIDRSVESMDFAFRRRFAFMEIKAMDRVAMLDDLQWKKDAIERMKKLNAAIEKIEGLSSAYHIGPAYFLKLKNYNGDFDQLWEYHIEGLLFEYMRGMTDVNANLKALANAYGYSKANNYGQPSNN